MHAVELDATVGNKAIKAFTDFSFYCGKDSLAPVFLLKASEIATSINNLPQAQLCLEKCIADFPTFENRGAAYFLLARLYDEPSQLNNEAKAEELYHLVKSQYPNTPWAVNADAALQLLGKSDAEIVREFEKKNKGKK
jgi:TolA-binding protein